MEDAVDPCIYWESNLVETEELAESAQLLHCVAASEANYGANIQLRKFLDTF